MGWTIGELAKRAGLRPSAIRFYERRGLTEAPPRKSGRRDYSERDLRGLKLIIAARAAGFTVAEIGVIAAAQDSEDARASARRRVAAISAEIDRLTTIRESLAGALTCACASLSDCDAFG